MRHTHNFNPIHVYQDLKNYLSECKCGLKLLQKMPRKGKESLGIIKQAALHAAEQGKWA